MPLISSSYFRNSLNFIFILSVFSAIVESFGRLFKPIVYDMNGNIEVSTNEFLLINLKWSEKLPINYTDFYTRFLIPSISSFDSFIQKLFHIYVQNEIDYMFLDDMLKSGEQQIQSCARDALLWLKRWANFRILV